MMGGRAAQRTLSPKRASFHFKLGLANSPRCERCLEKGELATHILCDSEAIAYLRFCHMGHYFMEPSDYHDTPIREVLHFIRSAGLTKG
jgi:hypothetical protein